MWVRTGAGGGRNPAQPLALGLAGRLHSVWFYMSLRRARPIDPSELLSMSWRTKLAAIWRRLRTPAVVEPSLRSRGRWPAARRVLAENLSPRNSQ